MKNKTHIFILLILFLGFTNLELFAQENLKNLKKTPTRRLVKNVIKNYLDYKNLSYKITAKITTPSNKYKLNISCRIIKDSIIWINANHASGIAVARIIITQDSTKFLNKLKKTYTLKSNKELLENLEYHLDFNTLQSILSAELINWENNKSIIKAYRDYKSYKDSSTYLLQNLKKRKLKRILKKDKIDKYILHRIHINRNYKIINSEFDDYASNQNLQVSYTKYKTTDIGTIPTFINLLLKVGNDTTIAYMKIRKYKFNKKKLNFPFRIPKSYNSIQNKKSEKKLELKNTKGRKEDYQSKDSD